ncbi:electron transfer flavoprotein subunit alpha/FixB family protein [Ruminiclostridium herbifermentans]|uniref:Electron transfer flavoprotein subunit alpha/FixB family protein n=1 Tax=Ruminiclostridium herbifermentans TaxID=2488810 RepID=A0A7H1VLI5_9FIRM|nr:electron transfer flavoprotein subunit alpha/FixB family protein [Ruminiclostridium herbifermentans]QNU66247.1 electron transfer flavoprotein subunit alpha/FixB family protein [Ruminiclostridium herbifermentans]
MSLNNYKDVFVFIEYHNGVINEDTYRLLSVGKELAIASKERLCAVVIHNNLKDEDAHSLIKYGSDIVYVLENNLSLFQEDLLVDMLTDFCKDYRPNVFLFTGSLLGKSIAPQISYNLKTGLTADCTDLKMDSNDVKILIQKRPAFEGNLYAEIKCQNTRPQMATVKRGIAKEQKRDEKRIGDIIRLRREGTDKSLLRIIDVLNTENLNCNSIEKSSIVIGIGRGVKEKKVYLIIKELAKLLNAEIGFTRPASENDWADKNNLIGQTGISLNCNVYLAFGISGALQHVSGILNCNTIIAVNNDKNAGIFNYATYGIVGDNESVAKNLISIIKKLTNRYGHFCC